MKTNRAAARDMEKDLVSQGERERLVEEPVDEGKERENDKEYYSPCSPDFILQIIMFTCSHALSLSFLFLL